MDKSHDSYSGVSDQQVLCPKACVNCVLAAYSTLLTLRSLRLSSGLLFLFKPLCGIYITLLDRAGPLSPEQWLRFSNAVPEEEHKYLKLRFVYFIDRQPISRLTPGIEPGIVPGAVNMSSALGLLLYLKESVDLSILSTRSLLSARACSSAWT